MNFEIEKKFLIHSLENVIRAIDPNNIYFQLRNIYVTVLDELIIIKGSNGYFSIEDKIIESKAIIKSIGEFLIPANIFINIIRKCEGLIKIRSEQNVLFIENENDKYEISLITEEYPSIDFSLYGSKIEVNAEKLKKAIENVIFATSQSNEEPILTGVNIKYNMNTLIITATDSFRLARETIQIPDGRDITFDITVANKNLKTFIPSDIKGNVVLYANEQKINMINEDTNFQSKVIEAPYKMVEQLFQMNFNKVLNIEKSILNNAINKACVVSNDNRIALDIDSDKITLSVNSSDIGRTDVVIEKSKFNYVGDPIKIILNYKFLKEAINVFNDKIRINLKESREMIMIESEDSTNKQLICPMNL